MWFSEGGRRTSQAMGVGFVVAAKAIGDERLKGNVLLPEESAAREHAVVVQINHGSHCRCGGDLDGAPRLAEQLAVIDLARIAKLSKETSLPAGNGTEDQGHVLRRDGDSPFKDLLEHGALVSQAQLVEEEGHQLAMATVTHRLVVQVA